MTQRTQFRAECAHCGRDHAVRGVRMVAHGYKVPTGWHQFVGTCAGTDRPHFGTVEGREYRAAIAQAFRDLATRLALTVASILDGTVSGATSGTWR